MKIFIFQVLEKLETLLKIIIIVKRNLRVCLTVILESVSIIFNT